jgi:hypothetical protein
MRSNLLDNAAKTVWTISSLTVMAGLYYEL